MKIENMLQKFSCISFLFKPPWSNLEIYKIYKTYIKLYIHIIYKTYIKLDISHRHTKIDYFFVPLAYQ